MSDDQKKDDADVSAFENVATGERMPAEQAAQLAQMLASGEMKIEIPDEVRADMAKLGMTEEGLREFMIAGAKKSLS